MPPQPARQPPSKRDAARDLGAGGLLDQIALGDVPDRPLSYDTTYGYGAFVPPGSKVVSDMTMDEVQMLQREMISRQRGKSGITSSVVGKYQFKADELVIR